MNCTRSRHVFLSGCGGVSELCQGCFHVRESHRHGTCFTRGVNNYWCRCREFVPATTERHGAYWKKRGQRVDIWVCLLPMLPIHFMRRRADDF